jgi:glycosyltransferase involved in cell wall biosynthesis
MPSPSSRVSILIPCYQQGRFLAGAVHSALAQTHADCEIVIVNDGSTDETSRIANDLSAQYPGRVRLIEQENRGLAAARMAALTAATGAWIVALDADDGLMPDMAEACLAAAAAHPEADAIVGHAELTGADGLTPLRVLRQDRIPDWPEVLEHNPFGAGMAVLIQRTALEGAGGWDPALRACEDWDLWARMIRCGMCFIPVDRVLGRYRQSAAALSQQAESMLAAKLTVLARALEPDPRIADRDLVPAPPISETEYQR